MPAPASWLRSIRSWRPFANWLALMIRLASSATNSWTGTSLAEQNSRHRRLAMPASLIRSRALITGVIDRHRWNEIADGALVQEDGVITQIGTYAALSRQHPE